MSHTPGPWRQHSTAPDRIIVNGSCVYRVRDMTTNEDGQYGRPNLGDVQLMAAAPDLLAALKTCRARLAEWVDSGSSDIADYEAVRVAGEAIAKAEGRGE